MTWTTALAIYFIVWWVVLFAVLPWGVRSQAESEDVSPGTDPGAPAVPALGLKALWTTAISGVLFGAFYWAYVTNAIALDDLATLWGLLK